MEKLLNKEGRLALVQSVLTSIPNYYMQNAWLPSSICEHIDKYAHNFFRKGNKDKGVHLVGWDKIARSLKAGCLGIRRAHKSNTTMLGKLV
jgi:hypothetical protein